MLLLMDFLPSIFLFLSLLAVMIIHLLFLHQTGSNNPLGVKRETDKIPFHPYFKIKDLVGFLVILICLVLLTQPPSTALTT